MNTLVLETKMLPSPIKEKFRTVKVSVKESKGGGVILMPLRDVSKYKGMMKGSAFTTEKLSEYRKEEKALEDRGLQTFSC